MDCTIKEMREENHETMIALCGDVCSACPRFNAHNADERKAVAKLWHKIGWRNKVVSNEEIACLGCSPSNSCTYQLIDCAAEHHVSRCNQCEDFPCSKIQDMLKRSAESEEKCKSVCSKEEFAVLKKAFFKKESNLE